MACRFVSIALFTLICAVLTHAQSKVAFIDSNAFLDETAGITKFVGAFKSLNDGFKPDQVEIDGMNTRLQALTKEIEDLLKLPAADQNGDRSKVQASRKTSSGH